MLEKIKEWFVSLPQECQEDFSHLTGLSLVTGKYIDETPENSIAAFIDFMDSNGLSKEETLNRILKLYSIIDMTIGVRLKTNWEIPPNLINAITNSRSEKSISFDDNKNKLINEWNNDVDAVLKYMSEGENLWKEISLSWNQLKENELGCTELFDYYILGRIE